MSFIQDIMIESVSSAEPKERIRALSRTLSIPENKALFLLMLYSWKDEEIISDLTSHTHLTSMLTSYVHEFGNLLALNQTCSGCGFSGECTKLDCQHTVCPHCLTVHVDTLLAGGRALLVCPAEGCNKFLNPSALNALPNGIRSKFSEMVLLDFISKVKNPDPFLHLKRGLGFVWVNRGALLTAGLAGAAAFGTHRVFDYRQKHPQTWKGLTIIAKKVSRGDNPTDFTFWVKTWLEAKFGIGR